MKVSSGLAILFIICIAIAAWGFFIEPSLLIQKNIKLEHWTGPNLKIAFLSDLHAGAPHIDKDYIENLVERINKMSPDIVLIGGDLVINGVVGGHPMPISQVANLLKELKAPLGIYAVLGNHDWWNNGELVRKTLEQNQIVVLDNQSKLITMSSNFSFWLIGIGDEFTQHANISKALEQVTTDSPKILFMHDPAAIFQMKSKFFLSLAGHLHGGQIYIPGLGALVTPGKAPRSWASGWIDFELGSLFVSQGVGTSILPVRINAPPEFVILELKN